MAEMDKFKIKEITSFRDKLVSTGMISQSMVTGLEDVVGENIITATKRIQHFTGTESHYGCKEVIDILNTFLDSEAGLESFSSSTYSNVDTLLSTAINILRMFLPSVLDTDKSLRNPPVDIYSKLFSIPMDQVFLKRDHRESSSLKIGNLTGPEFISALGAVAFTKKLSETLRPEFSRDVELLTNIIAQAEKDNSLANDFRDDGHNDELARRVYKLAFESLLTDTDTIAKIPGFTTNSVNYNLYTINEFVNRGLDVINLLSDTLAFLESTRTLYRNNELFNSMSISSLIMASIEEYKGINKPTYHFYDGDKRTSFVKLNNKSLSSIKAMVAKNHPGEEEYSLYCNVTYIEQFAVSLIELISNDDSFIKLTMLKHQYSYSEQPGKRLADTLDMLIGGSGDAQRPSSPSTIFRCYLSLLSIL